jgi:hypothetical protein
MRKETIAQQNAQRISPARVRGRLCAPPLCFIHHVIVHKRGDMDEFTITARSTMSRVNLASCAASQKRHQRTQTFAPAADCVHRRSLDCRIERPPLLRNAFLDFFKMRLETNFATLPASRRQKRPLQSSQASA